MTPILLRRPRKPVPAGTTCACGCGQELSQSRSNGLGAGFVRGHMPLEARETRQVRMNGAGNPNWKGGRKIDHDGYILIRTPEHPHGNADNRVFEHRLIVERAMGKLLRRSAEVHHVNQIKSDNRNANLVACDSLSYHQLLHRRQRALDACGNANWSKCSFCHVWTDGSDMYHHTNGRHSRHRECANRQQRAQRASRRTRLANA